MALVTFYRPTGRTNRQCKEKQLVLVEWGKRPVNRIFISPAGSATMQPQ